MKKANCFISYNGEKYLSEEECREADIKEMLRRFVMDVLSECHTTKIKQYVDALYEQRDIISHIFAGEEVYPEPEYKAEEDDD